MSGSLKQETDIQIAIIIYDKMNLCTENKMPFHSYCLFFPRNSLKEATQTRLYCSRGQEIMVLHTDYFRTVANRPRKVAKPLSC